MTLRLVISLVVIGLFVGAPRTAQAAPQSPTLKGKTVRLIFFDGRLIEGSVKQQTSDTLVVDDATIRIADLRSVAVADGIRDGIIHGIVGGTVAGILIGAMGDELSLYVGPRHHTNGATSGAIIGGLLGALIGGLLDNAHREWETQIVFSRATATIAPVATAHSLGIGGSLRW